MWSIQTWYPADVNMKRRGKQSKICRTEILLMSLCRDEESKIKYIDLKHCRYQYAEIRKPKSNIKNWNTTDVNMHKQGRQSQIYRTEILEMSVCRDEEGTVKYREIKYCRYIPTCRDEESKVKYTKLTSCRCQYGKRREAKSNI